MRRKERLGLAYATLNGWEWDDFIGEKPENFDNLLNWCREDKTVITKSYYISPKMDEIEKEIGKAACSRYWWKFALKKGFVPWFMWYYLKINTYHI